MDVIFAKTRYHYDSYNDFWRLVELAGFQTCHVDEIDLAARAIYITSPINGEIRPHIKHRKSIAKTDKNCQIIWWNLERPGPNIEGEATELFEYIDRIWVSDRYYATLDPRFEHVVLGSDRGLRLTSEALERHWDWTHQSYTSPRRDPIYGALRLSGLREGTNGWGDHRDRVLRASQLMLNVHQTDHPIGEPIRFALAAAYSLPMISEASADLWPLANGHDYREVAYELLVEAVIAARDQNLSSLGNNLHQTLCVDWTFRKGVERGIVRK
jgi:hypothetical protein